MTDDGIRITEAKQTTPELAEAIERMVPQLSSSSPPPTLEQLREVVDSPATVLFVAQDAAGRILGSLTLVLFRIPTGMRAIIEDVVVDESARGHALGERLSRAAIRRAGEAGARTVDLTSRPSRAAANHIYRKIGFVERDTNVYRYEL